MKLTVTSIVICLLCATAGPSPAKAQAEFFTTAHTDNQSRELKTSPFDTVFQDVFWDYGDSSTYSPTGISKSDQLPASLFGERLQQSADLGSYDDYGSYGNLIVRGQSSSSEGEGGGSNAGQQAQNPLASLVSVPFQSNFNYGVGPEGETQYVGLLEPVVPFAVNECLTWISRPIISFVDSPVPNSSNESGLGDLQWENVLVPTPPEGSPWTWGVGVDATFPTASNPATGRHLWAVGPLFVVVYSDGPIVSYVILTQSWSEGGKTQPFFLQPYFNYNFSDEGILKDWFIFAGAEFEADWEAPSSSRWNNVMGLGPGRNVKLFGQPLQVKARFAKYVDTPVGADWQFQFTVNMLFPK